MIASDKSASQKALGGALLVAGSFMRSAIGIALFVFFFSSFALLGCEDDQRDEAVEQRKEIVLETLAQFMEHKKNNGWHRKQTKVMSYLMFRLNFVPF